MTPYDITDTDRQRADELLIDDRLADMVAGYDREDARDRIATALAAERRRVVSLAYEAGYQDALRARMTTPARPDLADASGRPCPECDQPDRCPMTDWGDCPDRMTALSAAGRRTRAGDEEGTGK